MQPPAAPVGVQVAADDEDEAEKVYDVEPAALVGAPAEEKHLPELVRVVEGADGAIVELVELDVPDVPAVHSSLLVLSNFLSQLLGRYELRLKEERAVTERLKAQRDATATLVKEAQAEKGKLENELAALEVEAYRASKFANRTAPAYVTPSFALSGDSAEVLRPTGPPPAPPVAPAMGLQAPASQVSTEENGGAMLGPVKRKNKIGAGSGTGVGNGAPVGAISAVGAPDWLPAPAGAPSVERLPTAAPVAPQVPSGQPFDHGGLGSSGAKKKNKISR